MKLGYAEPVEGDGIQSNSYLQIRGINKLLLSDSSDSSVINPHLWNCSLYYTHKKMHNKSLTCLTAPYFLEAYF